MEKALYERWGNFGLGMLRKEKRPEIGPVHLASGFLVSEMLGCRVEYYEDKAPEVIQAHREDLIPECGGMLSIPLLSGGFSGFGKN